MSVTLIVRQGRDVSEVERLVFLAEVWVDEDPDRVKLRYVIDGSSELSLSRDWWEQLGRPERVEVEVPQRWSDGRRAWPSSSASTIVLGRSGIE